MPHSPSVMLRVPPSSRRKAIKKAPLLEHILPFCFGRTKALPYRFVRKFHSVPLSKHTDKSKFKNT